MFETEAVLMLTFLVILVFVGLFGSWLADKFDV